MLNAFGLRGWELVTVLIVYPAGELAPEEPVLLAYLKRPLPPTAQNLLAFSAQVSTRELDS